MKLSQTADVLETSVVQVNFSQFCHIYP